MSESKKLYLFDQGDVLIIANAPAPKAETKEIKPDPRRGVVLAYGEVTGHAHALPPDMVARFVVNEATAQRFLKLKSPTEVKHEEHRALELPADGWLEVDGQVEYVPGKLARPVVD